MINVVVELYKATIQIYLDKYCDFFQNTDKIS